MTYTFSKSKNQGQAQVVPGALKPLGYQQISSPAAAAALTPPTGALLAVIAVETQAIRYRDDGTSPTASVGMPLAVGSSISYQGDMSAFKVIQQVAGAVVNVSYYG